MLIFSPRLLIRITRFTLIAQSRSVLGFMPAWLQAPVSRSPTERWANGADCPGSDDMNGICTGGSGTGDRLVAPTGSVLDWATDSAEFVVRATLAVALRSD